ncbi:MAG: choice-of-anchor B family protein [Flavobacteriales bacterium]|nr:choice-of-anchor B family protein [Flavobacteriales bacterium]
MRHLATAFLLALSLSTSAQLNISFVGQLNYQTLRNSNLSNLWGYTDEFGNEYALLGVCGSGAGNPGGLAVVSLADPTDPQEIFFFPGPSSTWREIKVWGDHAYVTTEANSGGLTIVDLSPLPQSTNLPAIVWDAPDWDTSHSLFIDENGRLYLHGSDRGEGGVIMYDLTQDPMNPVEVGEFDDWYCHDSFARGDTLYAAHVYDGFFSIVDVSDPSAPVLLGTRTTPNEFTHNTWLDDSGRFLFTTDERTNSYVGAYDVSDPTDITEVDRLRSDNGSGAIPHNTYWLNDYVVTSYYTYGVAVYDVSDPHNMVEVGNYDTTPLTGDGFNGAWGVYPYFSSGRLIISDIERGLFVLDPTYIQACRLEGLVTNAQTSAPVGNATVQIVSTTAQDVTGIDGLYGTGYHAGGSYTVSASAPGYISNVTSDVALVNGQITVLNIQLQPLVPFNVTGTVIEAGSGDPVPNATVEISSPTYAYTAQSGLDGSFTISGVFADDYEVLAGRWGWHTTCFPPQLLQPSTGPLTIELPVGYADDFALHLGWTTGGTASSGIWERDVPIGTTLGNGPANPGADVPGDCGAKAYVTGNGGGGSGTDDVDGGSVVLTSPVFDATLELEAHVRYARWFVNGGGSGNPNDQFTITLSNGVGSVTIETVTATTAGAGTWVSRDYRIGDFIVPTANMRLIATTADDNPGHVVEAGLDVFEIYYDSENGTEALTSADWSLFPNPSDGRFTLQVNEGQGGEAQVLDASGRLVARERIGASGNVDFALDLRSGAYVVRVISGDGHSSQARMNVVR